MQKYNDAATTNAKAKDNANVNCKSKVNDKSKDECGGSSLRSE
jgi:hypothetical protein